MINQKLKKIINKISSSSFRKFIFVTGASGVGKSTIIDHLKKFSPPEIAYYHSDSIKVPSMEEMFQLFGSYEKWQEDRVKTWLEKLLNIRDKNLIFFEGSFNPDFIDFKELKKHNINYQIICITLDRKARGNRLVYQRDQEELVSQDMENWQNLLIQQTLAHQGDIIYLTNETIEQAADKIITLVR